MDKDRESPFGKTNRDQKIGLEFEEKEYDEIDKYCKELILRAASAWDLNSLNFLDNYNLKYNKIASAMIIDKNFLSKVAQQKIYFYQHWNVILQRTMVVEIFKKENAFWTNDCVAKYPFEAKDASLNLIKDMRDRYNCKVGYSGHEKRV